MKKIISSLVVIGLLFGVISVVSAEGNQAVAVKQTKEEKAVNQLEKWQNRAAKLGITQTGQTLEQLKEAVHAAKAEKRAKAETKRSEKAAKWGIDPADKSEKQLKEEIQSKKASKQAEKKAQKQQDKKNKDKK
ncbi:hypothetical protein [uncultured Brevibacillus sp.]|uniref:hypothetical protein n=1 Tax=uncultured Brevibacillus sp. TaxID=169970 RepID=UPI002599433C|nr:hypothetical protein [uncultured Brevibacillus sp.]